MLLQHLSVQSLKHEYATLYGGLASKPLGDNLSMLEAFEEIPTGKKLESRAAWKRSAFKPYGVGRAAISAYLNHLFGQQDETKWGISEALKMLQQEVESFEADLATPLQFNHSSLKWAIQGLLKLNGTYNIHLHEDTLQAIFLQFIGVKWSVFLKRALKAFRRPPDAWKSSRKAMLRINRKRRDYYLGCQQKGPSIHSKRRSMHRKNYFLSQLPDFEDQEAVVHEGDEEAELEEDKPTGSRRTKETARMATGGAAPRKSHRKVRGSVSALARETVNDDSETQDDNDNTPKRPMDAKQSLLHPLSAEIIINTRMHGELTCFRSVFEDWNPLLPHGTVLAVLEFFGVSERWLAFFKKFFEAPLKFIDKPSQARIQRRGTPGSHSISDMLDGALLYRMHDDFWFWSPNYDKCVSAWDTVMTFIKTMDVSLNKAKTSAVRVGRDASKHLEIHPSLPASRIRWGFLCLHPQTGRFEIDQAMIDSHISELRLQLQGKTSSIFSWFQAWNTYAATFFAINFGKPANCYGRQHVDNMLSTHQRIHRTIFSSADGLGNGFLFFPIELSGPELKSSFVSLLQIRDTVLEHPSDLLDKFEENEHEAYCVTKTRFEKGDVDMYREECDDPDWEPESDKDVFMSFEEFTLYREEINYWYRWQLSEVFDTLLVQPTEEGIEPDANMLSGLKTIAGLQNPRGIFPQWHAMEPYWRWVAQIYGPEIMDQFGDFNVVNPGLLPMGLRRVWGQHVVRAHSEGVSERTSEMHSLEPSEIGQISFCCQILDQPSRGDECGAATPIGNIPLLRHAVTL
ncbi:hypothetical protein AOQ84DRAFT_419459 [Glonium stellatum]|uniref:Uncharacterized protein n=1 Tax=Glonium stellatum TaxID=574774 RepID=A0A8E2JWS0_9PEZI|nr:hypothetical protein AOQ84DRAFT_419459 [Glonium stellatum]